MINKVIILKEYKMININNNKVISINNNHCMKLIIFKHFQKIKQIL